MKNLDKPLRNVAYIKEALVMHNAPIDAGNFIDKAVENKKGLLRSI